MPIDLGFNPSVGIKGFQTASVTAVASGSDTFQSLSRDKRLSDISFPSAVTLYQKVSIPQSG